MGRDGNFREDGKVFSSYLMGGIDKNGDIAITAYTVISFLETELDESFTAEKEVARIAVDTLARNLKNVDDSHTLGEVD